MSIDHEYYAKIILKYLIDFVLNYKSGLKTVTYSYLAGIVNYPKNIYRGIPQYRGNAFSRNFYTTLNVLGNQLKLVDDLEILDRIPFIQCMIINKGTKLPGKGFEEFYIGFNSLEKNQKLEVMGKEIQKVFDFGKKWEKVLENLLEYYDIEDNGEFEGREKRVLILHKYFERKSRIINEKKEEARRKEALYCEICLFDFSKAYPIVGEGFIECHHKKPISLGERITRSEDLVLICSNCHRMLHRKYQSGFLSIEELKEVVNKGRK